MFKSCKIYFLFTIVLSLFNQTNTSHIDTTQTRTVVNLVALYSQKKQPDSQENAPSDDPFWNEFISSTKTNPLKSIIDKKTKV